MKFTFNHSNFNIVDLNKSLEFYKKALGLEEVRRKIADDGSFILVYLGDGLTEYNLELTWIKDFDKEKYELGDNEFHLAFKVDNFREAYKLHEEMGCICYDNTKMGIYFIVDPDGYWIEIIPTR